MGRKLHKHAKRGWKRITRIIFDVLVFVAIAVFFVLTQRTEVFAAAEVTDLLKDAFLNEEL